VIVGESVHGIRAETVSFSIAVTNARLEWYKKIGLSLEQLMIQGQAIVLRNLEISYINEAHLGDRLTITTMPYQRGKSSFTLKQKIYNKDNEIITEAEAVTVMIDLEKRKSIPLINSIGMYFDFPVQQEYFGILRKLIE